MQSDSETNAISGNERRMFGNVENNADGIMEAYDDDAVGHRRLSTLPRQGHKSM